METAFLEVRRHNGLERVELAGAQVTIGRASENTVSFPDDNMVSRRHAVLTAVSDGWSLRDTESVNGTYVNGERLVGERLLKSGDRVTFGTSRLVYRVGTTTAGPSDAASPAQPLGQGPSLHTHAFNDEEELDAQADEDAPRWAYVTLAALAVLLLVLLCTIWVMVGL